MYYSFMFERIFELFSSHWNLRLNARHCRLCLWHFAFGITLQCIDSCFFLSLFTFFCQRCILFFAFTHSHITYLRTYKLNTYVYVGISTCDKTLFGEFMRKLSSVWVLRLFCHPSNDSWHIFWQVSPRVQRQKYQTEIDWATNWIGDTSMAT